MNESHAASPRRGRAKKDKAQDAIVGPHPGGEPASGGHEGPVELEPVLEHRPAKQDAWLENRGQHREDLDLYPVEPPVEWDYDDEPELEPDYDEEFELEPDDEEEPEFGPGEGRGHYPGSGRGPEPRLAPGPKRGPGHHPGPPHEHGLGPKKTPGKKAPGKKAPVKKAPGPKKHPGPPPPPHEHGPGHPPPPPHHHGPGHPPPSHEHDQGHDPGGPVSEADFGFGPDAGFGFGPDLDFGSNFGFDPGGTRSRRRRSGRGRRVRPGDVRAAILTLLAERPMHGYEMIQEIADRTEELWRPSPGSVYPTLQLLDDQGLIVSSESDRSTKLFELSEEGRAAAEKIKTPPWKQFTKGVDSGPASLRAALAQLIGAVAQSAYAFTAEEQQRIIAILKNARREIYKLLAESE